jgi:hypothetical protein
MSYSYEDNYDLEEQDCCCTGWKGLPLWAKIIIIAMSVIIVVVVIIVLVYYFCTKKGKKEGFYPMKDDNTFQAGNTTIDCNVDVDYLESFINSSFAD